MTKTIADRIVDAKNSGKEAVFTSDEIFESSDPDDNYYFNPKGLATYISNSGLFAGQTGFFINDSIAEDIASVNTKINEILDVLRYSGLINPA